MHEISAQTRFSRTLTKTIYIDVILARQSQYYLLLIFLDVTILAYVTWKMLGKEMLDHLDDVEQYYRWW